MQGPLPRCGRGFLANTICDSLAFGCFGEGRERQETGEQNLFRSRLDQIIAATMQRPIAGSGSSSPGTPRDVPKGGIDE